MKIYHILLLVTSCLCQQGFISLKEDMPQGFLLTEFSCTGKFNTTNIDATLFKTVNQTKLCLNRTIKLARDFTTKKDNSTCLNMINDTSMALNWKCQNTLENHHIDIKLGIPSSINESLCFKNCSKINSPYKLMILENTTVDETLLDFKICDDQLHASSDTTPYAGEVGVSGDVIDERNKNSIILHSPVDYEHPPSNLTSYVTIKGFIALTINIEIGDADDQGIEFEQTVYNCSISEGESTGETKCNVKANDLDKGINQTINYELFSVTPSDKGKYFDVTSNGTLQLLKKLDREKVNAYYITVKGFQTNNKDRANYTSIKVDVTDIDDNRPEMLKTTHNVSVMENSPVGNILCVVSATDRDIGVNAKFRYKMKNKSEYFTVNESTGLITVKASVDRETLQSEELKIYAEATNKTNWTSNFSIVHITVLDENDNTPKFNSSDYSIILKTIKNGSAVLKMNVSDPDEGSNGKFECSMQPKSDSFVIRTELHGCVIYLTSSLNDTEQLLYTFDVTVKDKATDSTKIRSSTERVTINVTDVNIHEPKFEIYNRSLSILESTEIGTILVILKASDKDPTDILSYSVSEVDNKFKIREKNRLYLAEKLDRETEDFYNISVTVTDGNHTEETYIQVTVLDVNDNSPIFENSNYTFNIKEGPGNSTIGKVNATDADKGENGKVEYFIDDDSKCFRKMNICIDGESGIISTTGIDREQIPDTGYISFFVIAKDKGTPALMDQTFVKINVEDINDNRPILLETEFKFTVLEDTPLEYLTHIYKVQATDLDKSNQNKTIHYRLQDDVNEVVGLDNTSGVLSMLKLPHIDRQCTNQTFSFNVTAENVVPYIPNASHPYMTITIHIEDINNQRPIFELNSDMNITFNSDKWKPVINQSSLHDYDCNKKYRNITFHLTDGSDRRLQINSTNGKVKYKQNSTDPYRYPECSRSISVEMYATDGWFQTFRNTTLLPVQTFYDPIPVTNYYTIMVKENSTYNTSYVIGFLDCSDISLKISVNDSRFNIDQTGKNGTIGVTKALDYETEQEILVIVSAYNIEKPSASSRSLVRVIIEDQNDVSPVFTNKTYTYSLRENELLGSRFGYVSAFDKDTNSILTFGCTDDAQDYIKINNEGVLTLAKSLDLDGNNLTSPINATICVNDTIHVSYADVIIKIEKVNEFSPQFEHVNYYFSVLENKNAVWNITAHDQDVGEDGQIAKYSLLVPDNWIWTKNVNVTNEGNVHVGGIDRDIMGKNNKLMFAIEATDNGHPSRSGIAYITLIVNGTNDNKPEFPDNENNVSVILKENLQLYPSIYQSKAYDADIDEGSTIFYRQNNTMFDINNTTGVLSSTQSLLMNETNRGYITVIIEAYNEENETSSAVSKQTINIFIEDINNNIPVFENMPMSRNLSECTDIGTHITRVIAADADSSEEYNTVTYWTEDFVDKIDIDPRTGNVSVIGKLDVDFPNNRTVLKITIYATDDLKKRDTRSNHTVKSTLSVYLQDCNDNRPIFTKEKYVCYVNENRTGKFNCSVEAKDWDSTHTDINYTILSGNEKYVKITQNTGELSVVQSIDYEEKNSLILNISASDGQFSSSCMVEIHVIDANDERPQFHGTPYNFSIYENMNGSFVVVGRVNVTDADSNYDINFRNCTGMFNIIEKSDIILMKPFDYENQTIITCSLSANDTDHTKDEVTTNIVIHILDKNDNAPSFANNCCNVHAIDETTGPNKSVIKVKATDADNSAQNSQVVYAIFSGNSNLLFKIDRSSGEIKTNKNFTGYGGIIIHLVVKATDNGFPALSGYTNVSINVTKLNVNPPAFIGEPYKTKIYEGNDTRTIFEVHAKDKDNDKLEFKVLNFTDYFHFKNNTLYASNIDAENMNKTINVGVQVSDGKWSDESAIIIAIIDVNDNFPRVDVDSCNTTVDDIADVGDIICKVRAEDNDIDNDGFTYMLYDGKGDFKINRTTGVITLKNRFGHNGQNYSLNIVVSDSGSPPKYTNTSLSIHIKDTNPTFQFDSKQLEFNVTENVCDANAPVNVKPVSRMYNITYEIDSKNKYLINKTFYLNEYSGLLTIAKKSNCIDYEEQNEYKFSIFAKDDGVFPKSAHAEVTINVLDVNEPPNIILTNKTVFLNENSRKGTYVSRVFVKDPDTNEQFRNFKYSLSDSKNFKIDKNGTITIAATNIPAYAYKLNVTVTDGGDLSDSNMMHVNVPSINVTYVEKKIEENNTRYSDICNFTISLNGENVSYKIIAAPYSGNFRIESGSLILDTASAFDREEIEFVSFYVIGYYTKYGTSVANVSVKLHIEDINDCPPYFVDNYYNITINDVTESGTVIGKLDAIDRDIEKENRQLTYDIYTYTDIFAIDNKGNLILKNSTNLDLEIPYVLNVSVSDGIYLSHASVSVVVTDTNNYSPKFNNYTYEFTVTETNMTNIVIGSLSAEDKDKGRNGDITFSILTVNSDDMFAISNQTNNTCIVESVKPIDREAKEQFSLVIQATDHGIFPRQSTCIVRIKVLDENDNFPIFRGVSSLNGSIPENSVNGTRIKFPHITVYDVDFGINGTDGLIYTFNDTKAPFCIGTNKTTYPFVYLCGDIDREGQEVYYLELIARDANGTNGSHKSGIPLVVRILDVNDVFPKFTEDCYTFNVTENQIQYTTVGNVSITDDDSGKFFLYRIVSGDDGKFVIDSMNGNIDAVGSIDREAQANYTLNISVWDGVNKAYTTVQIYIADINDNAPQFGHFWNDSLKESLTVEVLENTHKGVILNLTAFDRDATKNGVVKYTLKILSQGGEPDVFNISTEGGLTLLRPLDREKGDSYKMNVTASDEGVPKLSTSIIVHVKVLDENDNPPVFCNSSTCNITKSTCRTVEKAPVSSVLKVLLAHDPDEGENANVSFTMEQSSVSSLFKIETIGNSISLVSINQPLVTNNLIHEGVSLSADDVQVNVTIIATDGGGLNSSLILLIFVEPINDDMPVFARSVYNFNISENMPKGVTVGQCEATTNDTIKKMTYELISGYTNKPKPFKIETSSGRITTIADLDREMIDNYVFAVQVRDGRTPERTAFAAVKVTIDDINDNAPVFLDDNITLHITENKTVDIKRNVSANDLDKGENAHILYSLNNSYNGLFHINNSGLLIINGTFDYETKTSYTLFITASDKGLPALNTTSQVNIYVRDVNDNFPVFNKARKFYNVSENNKPFIMFSVNATDKDSGLNGEVIYKLQNIDDVPFGIDPFSGSVYLQSQLDYESKAMYSLSIVAQDLGSPSNNALENVTIYVVDVYDDIIKFKKDLYEINITTSASRNDSLLNLTVSVPNSIFSLKGVDSEYFNIGEKSGEIVLKKSISSKRQMYVFQAVADDGHGRNASCTVIAHVIGHDVNFDTSEIKLSLMENLNKSTVLVDLNTTAEFSSDGATYTISNVLPTGMDLFFVEPRTGVLKCIKPLDREKYAQYTIIIYAHTSALRRKREISRATSSIKIIVNVDDVNDNPPHFTNDQERVFGVPDNVRANYIVGVIKARDNDTSDAGKLRYNVTGGRSDVFGVSRVTGEIITLVAIASTTGKSFYLSISVTDGDASHKDATINVTIHVVPTKNQPILTVNLRVDDINKKLEDYRRNMSEILDIQVQFERVESHREVDETIGMTRVDLSKTDLIFHGVNTTSGFIVSNEKMEQLLNIHNLELSQLFGMESISPNYVIIDVIADPSAISATQILFICMAVFIFFGSLAALVVAQYSWSRIEMERQEAEKNVERLENEMELSTIRSRQSSKLSSIIAAAAVNPAFAETEFTGNGKIVTQTEEQEMHMLFGDEPLEAILNAQGLGSASQSVIDSGVGHTSVHSDANCVDTSDQNMDIETPAISQSSLNVQNDIPVNDEGPVMTSSPRISRESKPMEDKVITIKNSDDKAEIIEDPGGTDITKEIPDQVSRSRTASFLLLDATGESETDDAADDTDVKKKRTTNAAEQQHDKPKKVVRLQLPSESTPQDPKVILIPGSDEGNEGSSDDGNNIYEENEDDSEIECTSF